MCAIYTLLIFRFKDYSDPQNKPFELKRYRRSVVGDQHVKFLVFSVLRL